jgi:hypothetical protein
MWETSKRDALVRQWWCDARMPARSIAYWSTTIAKQQTNPTMYYIASNARRAAINNSKKRLEILERRKRELER